MIYIGYSSGRSPSVLRKVRSSPGGGGLRKLRWSAQGRGKRGGIRLIYYWDPPSHTFYMLYLYAKNEQGDLTSSQTKALARLVREEFT